MAALGSVVVSRRAGSQVKLRTPSSVVVDALRCCASATADVFIPSSPSNASVLHSGGRERCWEG